MSVGAFSPYPRTRIPLPRQMLDLLTCRSAAHPHLAFPSHLILALLVFRRESRANLVDARLRVDCVAPLVQESRLEQI